MPIGSHELEGQTLAQGRYWVTQKLGEGGMGTVYRAQDRNIESDVVIKIPHQVMMNDPEFASRFTREIRSLVKLSHPHIVKVSDVGTWDGTPFAVMQFLPGGSLEDRRPVGSDGEPYPCDPALIPAWLEAVAQALDYIHVQGYVHRDVKPGNILFDAEGHAFLSDFGVAKVLASAADAHPSKPAMTGTGMVLGTPEYMAPELIMGEPFDGRADQYALAITVYELLCGRRPFENETKTKLLVLHTSKAPPLLTEWCPEIPEPLSQVVLKGLNKEPADRFPSCAAFAAAVVATTTENFARDGRVRLKCPQCGKTGGMAAADYGRLRKSGGRPACSVCKVPLDLAKEGSGGYNLASDPQRTRGGAAPKSSPPSRTPRPTLVEPTPGTPRPVAKTMIETSAQRSGEQKGLAPRSRGPQPTLIESVPQNPRPVAKTMIERASPRMTEFERIVTSGEDGASINQTLKMPAQKRSDFQLSGPSHSKLNPKWIAVGGGGVASVLMLTFVGVSMMSSNKAVPKPVEPLVAAVTPSANKPSPSETLPDRPRPADVPAETEPSPAVRPKRKNMPGRGRPATKSMPKAVEPETPDPSLAAQPGAPAPGESEKKALASLTPKGAMPVRVPGPKFTPFNPEILKSKPEKRYALSKVLAEAKDYAERLVVPTGMFHLAPAPDDNANGQRKYLVIERKMQEQRNNMLGMTSAQALELEVEPMLAARLDAVGTKKLAKTMSIVTIWFNTGGNPMIVKLDILLDYKLDFKKATVLPVGNVNYLTLQVTPDGQVSGEPDDREWETPERFLHFANNYKRRVKTYKKMLHTQEMFALSKVMGGMYQGMLNGAAANEAQQRQLRAGVGGKF